MNQEELKQRLIELIAEKPELLVNINISARKVFAFAEHLIENGVMIRERGEWKRQKGRPEAICPFCETEVVYKVVNNRWAFEDFCPHCGADMRGGKDE